MVAGKEATPEDAKNTERLKEYWRHGNGAAIIQWGAPGDFGRCVKAVGVHLKDPEGYCAELHHDVVGVWLAALKKIFTLTMTTLAAIGVTEVAVSA